MDGEREREMNWRRNGRRRGSVNWGAGNVLIVGKNPKMVAEKGKL